MCRVVLVRTQFAGNLGAVARAMRNFGLRDLVLVAPQADRHDREARRLSTHGERILDSARIVTDFGEAVSDCVMVAATSARVGGLFRGQSAGWPEQILPRLIEASQSGPVALVFGPESSGLTNAEVARCQALIRIPAHDDYPALNLAQSVAICLAAWYRLSQVDASQVPSTEPPADFADQERAFQHLREGLEAIHFLYGDKSDALMFALRQLIGRARPTAMEVKLLHGLARQLLWAARSGSGA